MSDLSGNLSGKGTLKGALGGGGGSPTPTDVYWDDILEKPDFAAVATSGSYNDLLDKPTIPIYTAGDGISIENGVISATNSGGDVLEFKPAYILFRNGFKYNHIDTYLPQLDWEYYIDFYINQYENDKAILGNNQNSYRIHLTMYDNKWYTSTGDGEFSFGDSSMIIGRHNFTWNRIGDRKILFDGAVVGTTNGYVDSDLSVRLNDRTDGMACSNSRIYEFRIKNPNGDIIYDFKPFSIYKNGVLIDKRIIDVIGGMVLNNGYYEIVEVDDNE